MGGFRYRSMFQPTLAPPFTCPNFQRKISPSQRPGNSCGRQNRKSTTPACLPSRKRILPLNVWWARATTNSAKCRHIQTIRDFQTLKIFAIATQPLLTLLIASITFGASGSPSAPEGLLVNGVSEPLAVDRDAIRFTWRSKAATRGETQPAYQILVASSVEQLADWTAD